MDAYRQICGHPVHDHFAGTRSRTSQSALKFRNNVTAPRSIEIVHINLFNLFLISVNLQVWICDAYKRSGIVSGRN